MTYQESAKKHFVFSTAEDTSEAVIGAINALLAVVGCPEAVRRNIDVALDEICTNISEYAYPGSSGSFSVDVELEANRLDLLISDSGVPFNPLDRSDTLQGDENGGFGINIVRKLMDTMEYFHEGGRNKLHIAKTWEP